MGQLHSMGQTTFPPSSRPGLPRNWCSQVYQWHIHCLGPSVPYFSICATRDMSNNEQKSSVSWFAERPHLIFRDFFEIHILQPISEGRQKPDCKYLVWKPLSSPRKVDTLKRSLDGHIMLPKEDKCPVRIWCTQYWNGAGAMPNFWNNILLSSHI